MGLHYPEGNDYSVLARIYEVNCYEMGRGTCVCLEASKNNHSCVPNAYYSWNNDIKRLTVHAIRKIPEGEEITIS